MTEDETDLFLKSEHKLEELSKELIQSKNEKTSRTWNWKYCTKWSRKRPRDESRGCWNANNRTKNESTACLSIIISSRQVSSTFRVPPPKRAGGLGGWRKRPS